MNPDQNEQIYPVLSPPTIYAPPRPPSPPPLPPPPPLSPAEGDDQSHTIHSYVTVGTGTTDQSGPYPPSHYQPPWNDISPMPTPPPSRPSSDQFRPFADDDYPVSFTPASPGRMWVEHSREKAQQRRNSSNKGDELGWSRHSVESTSTGRRASIKYDEIELGMRRAPPPLPPSIYFGGCAFGASFYIGCIRALCDMYGPQFYKDCLICGDSGGSIFAVGLSLGYHPEELYQFYTRICENTRRSHHSFYEPTKKVGASVFLARELEWLLSDPSAYTQLNGRCWVGITHYQDKHVWIKSYKDNYEVYTAVMGSCHIPVYCGPNRPIDRRHVVDGAFSVRGENLPHGDETLYVGISRHADITRKMTKEQLLQPPDAAQFSAMEQTGYEAMWAWNGLTRRKTGGVMLPDKDGLNLLWCLKCLELSWIAIIVVGLSIVIFVTLMCVHFYNGLF